MPPGTTTLATVRTAVRQRTEMVNSQFVTDAELNSYINASYYELYDLLVQKFGDDYFVATAYLFTADGVADSYTLPSDFYKGLGLDIAIDALNWASVRRFNMGERNDYRSGEVGVRYRLRGSSVWFPYKPDAGQNFRYWYIPRLTALVNDSDVIDGVSGWEEYIVVDVGIKVLAKEESDTTQLERAKGALIQRIEAAAENRDTGAPFTVQDTRADDVSTARDWP